LHGRDKREMLGAHLDLLTELLSPTIEEVVERVKTLPFEPARRFSPRSRRACPRAASP
jgi:hypothetical protein